MAERYRSRFRDIVIERASGDPEAQCAMIVALVEATGYSYYAAARVESGMDEPTQEYLAGVAAALGLPVACCFTVEHIDAEPQGAGE